MTIKRQVDAETRILGAFEPGAWAYGLDLMRRTSMRSARFYSALRRLESAGLVEAKWDEAEISPGRHRRMYRRTEP